MRWFFFVSKKESKKRQIEICFIKIRVTSTDYITKITLY